ncbi:hypothetical protein EZV62_003867 [Acer yangbiense]|uniref:Uncharacterized protein n=1 Tax=Acer yangbiense TaxID=1000413 RepID=A0A5C7IJV5_9ROSI|nr:hypothetical protein EZV62_003867 [Acer yangbiense]
MSKTKDIHLTPCAFTNMHELRFLNFYNSSLAEANKVHVSEALEFDFTELRYLSWHGCPIKSLLSCFLPENLVKLDMSYSKVEQLWNGVQHRAKLKEIKIGFSSITICPNLSGFLNLERLDLQSCEYLHEISSSIQDLDKLDFLNLSYCSNLEILPEMPCNLELLDLSGTAIEELPSSIKYLRRLVNLDLLFCKRLKSLPNSVCEWKSLESLKLSSCSMLEELPSDIGTLESLKDLVAEETAIKELPSSIIDLKKIETLSFNRFGVKGDTAVCWFLPHIVGWHNMTWLDLSYGGITNLPDNLDCLSSLRILHLDGNSFESIPTSIINLSNCKSLGIENCKKLKYLPALQLLQITAFGCTSLEVLPCLSIFQNIIDSSDFFFADFGNCCKLDPNILEDIVKDALRKIQYWKEYNYDEDDEDAVEDAFIRYPGSEIPKWFNFRSIGSFINVELPLDWFDYNYVGFVLSTVVAPCPDHQDGLEEYWCIRWNCNLKSKDGDPCVKTGTFDVDEICNPDIRSNHVFVDSCVDISRSELLCYDNEITFQFYIPHDMKQHKVEKCGVHLMFAQRREEVDGSSRIGEDEDVLSLANAHDNCEEEDELIKMIKTLCVLNYGMHVYLKEAFLLDSVGYLNVNCLDLASAFSVVFSLSAIAAAALGRDLLLETRRRWFLETWSTALHSAFLFVPVCSSPASAFRRSLVYSSWALMSSSSGLGVYSLLPCEASLLPSVVVSSGGPFMESLSSLLPREVSPPPPIIVSSGYPILESLPSGDHNKSVERLLQEHGISSSRACQRQTSVEEGRHRVSDLGGWRLVAREQKW